MKKLFVLTILALSANSSFAEKMVVDNATISFVAVSGGEDTTHPGTTCVKFSGDVDTSCVAGYVAIPNNNQQLLTAALTAKTTGSNLWVFYENSAANSHCPGLVFTPCSLISIMLKPQ